MSLEKLKLLGVVELDKSDIVYQHNGVVGVADQLPEGALRLREKPIGNYHAIDGEWVEVGNNSKDTRGNPVIE